MGSVLPDRVLPVGVEALHAPIELGKNKGVQPGNEETLYSIEFGRRPSRKNWAELRG